MLIVTLTCGSLGFLFFFLSVDIEDYFSFNWWDAEFPSNDEPWDLSDPKFLDSEIFSLACLAEDAESVGITVVASSDDEGNIILDISESDEISDEEIDSLVHQILFPSKDPKIGSDEEIEKLFPPISTFFLPDKTDVSGGTEKLGLAPTVSLKAS